MTLKALQKNIKTKENKNQELRGSGEGGMMGRRRMVGEKEKKNSQRQAKEARNKKRRRSP
jgi:hypothetical protein